jgi:hypothetical protein
MWVHPIHPISSMPMKENHAMLFFCAEKGLRDEYCACNHGFVLYLYAKIGAEIACADKKKTWND